MDQTALGKSGRKGDPGLESFADVMSGQLTHMSCDSAGTEVDLLYALADRLLAVEIKAGETISGSFFGNLQKLRRYLPERIAGEILVHGAENEMIRDDIHVTGPFGFVPMLERFAKQETN